MIIIIRLIKIILRIAISSNNLLYTTNQLRVWLRVTLILRNPLSHKMKWKLIVLRGNVEYALGILLVPRIPLSLPVNVLVV